MPHSRLPPQNYQYSNPTYISSGQIFEDDFLSAPLVVTALAPPAFYPLTSLPLEVQLQIFTCFLDSIIAETEGRTPYEVDGYTKIRQLMFEDGLKATLQTSKHVRSLLLAAWKVALGHERHLNTGRQERRVQKSLMLIELLEGKVAHVHAMRLLICSEKSWNEIKVQAIALTKLPTTLLQNEANKALASLNRRRAAMPTIEVQVLTYASCNNTPKGHLALGMLHYCYPLVGKRYRYGYSNPCKTFREF